jgi:methylated-DNA-[protein]-cysteine S-methyltransferase
MTRARASRSANAGGHVLFPTRIGEVGVAWSGKGLLAVQLPERDARTTRERLASRAGTSPSAPPKWVRDAIRLISTSLEGRRSDLGKVPLDLSRVPPFHRRVYGELRRIGAGRTASYAELASLAGSPAAARAVGQAMRKNPLPLVIPCHRVVAAGGRVGGFSAYGGVATKERLLAAEGVLLEAQRDGLTYSREEAVRHLRASDPRLARVIERVGPFTMPIDRLQSPFQALVLVIVHQQLHGKAAKTILGRVIAIFAPKRFPSPADLLLVDESRLRAAGLSGAKAAAVRDLARHAVEGGIPSCAKMRRMADGEIVERLTRVKGIGRWSVEMLMLFRLGRPDVWPVTDFGVRKGFARLMGRERLPGAKEMERYAERWRPYRSVAAWYLWRSLDGGA